MLAGGDQVAFGDIERIGQLLTLDLERFPTLLRFQMFARRAISIELDATGLIAVLAHLTLELLEHRARLLHGFARGLFGGKTILQCFTGIGQFLLERGAIADGALAIFAQATTECFVLLPLFLRPLLAHGRAALPLFTDRQLALQLLRLVALLRGQARKLGAAGFGRGPGAVCLFAQQFSLRDRFFTMRDVELQLLESAVECRQFLAPRRHLPGSQRYLHLEPTRHQLGMAFGATTLACQRTHLTLYLVDQVIEAREVDGRLLETALRAATTVAIQSDASGFLEQVTTFVGAVGQQGIDHPAFDHDAGIGAQARATHEILNVAQTARRTIQEILTLARAHQASRDHDFLERNGQRAFRVVEVQRDFGHVDGFSCRRAVKDHVFHLRAAHRARALLSQHPSHGVGYIRLATAIGTDDGRHPFFEHKLQVIGKGFEAMYFELRQTH